MGFWPTSTDPAGGATVGVASAATVVVVVVVVVVDVLVVEVLVVDSGTAIDSSGRPCIRDSNKE